MASSQAEFSYDAQGNLLRRVLDGEETRFESNLLAQLTAIEKVDKTALHFSYDPFGRLLVEKHLDLKGKRKKTLSTWRYFYIGYQEIGSLTQMGAIETLKVPGLKGEALSMTSVAFEIQGEAYVPLHDIAGNVVRLVDPQSREVVESYEYTAFGEERIYSRSGKRETSSRVGNPWRFAEKRVDAETGFVLFGFRFYDPSTGRWTSEDPAGFVDGPNLYAYLHNNPLSYCDRFGLASEALTESEVEGYQFGELETHCYCEEHRCCKRGGDIGKTTEEALPKVVYDDNFEQLYKNSYRRTGVVLDHYRGSTCYDLSSDGLPELAQDMAIGFTNGIWNSLEDAKGSARYLSNLAKGCNIHSVYNATHGLLTDPHEYLRGLKHIATEPVRQLHNMWDSFFAKSSSTAKLLMICHSQGVTHVMNALLDYPPELRKRILVVAIAPGSYVYKETCAKVVHYRTKKWYRDFVPRLDGKGAKREADTIVELESHADAALFDHEFMSPTYIEKLQEHIDNYISTNGMKL